MREVFGVILMILSVVLGLYVGVWLCFIGGIADVVNEIQNLITDNPVDGVAVGWGVVKIIFSGFLGSVTFYALFFPGCTMTLGGFKIKSFKIKRR